MELCGQSPQDHAWEQLQDLLVLGDDLFGHTDELCAGTHTLEKKDAFAQELQQYLVLFSFCMIKIPVDFIKHKWPF